MEDTISKPSMEHLVFSVDPMSLLLSHNSDTYEFERGPRYGEYASLRESKLRLKRDYDKILKEEEDRFFGGDQVKKTKQIRFDETRVSPEKTRFGFGFKPAKKPVNSSLAQSVPDFSTVIRKENRRPVNSNSNLLPPRAELTPPPTKSRNAAVFAGSASSVRGSMSAGGGEKKSKGMSMGMARKSYATVEDLKKISMAAASAINGGGGGRKATGGRRNSLGYRHVY